MLKGNGSPFIDIPGIMCGSDIPISVLFLVADESINSAIICSAIASYLTLIDDSGIEVDASLLIFWCI